MLSLYKWLLRAKPLQMLDISKRNPQRISPIALGQVSSVPSPGWKASEAWSFFFSVGQQQKHGIWYFLNIT